MTQLSDSSYCPLSFAGRKSQSSSRRIDAFELWCWRLLRVPWTRRRSNHSILKEIKPEYSLEGLMLKLKLQHFGHLMWKACKKMLGKNEGRRTGQQRIRWLDSITDTMDKFEQTLGDSEGQGSQVSCSPWGHKEADTTYQLNSNRRVQNIFSHIFNT